MMIFKCLPRRATSDNVLCDKDFSIAKNLKYDGYQCGIASMVFKFFDKKSLMLLTQEQELILIQILKASNKRKKYASQLFE